ncbi:HlyC/CorC family transporter [Candidatus Sumerlaeota bacterium]|nr:HlyC/CorC family transporter [Candidatus Sumerlaeota bacterium]
MMVMILMLASVLLCVFMTGFFAGSETGAISANRHRLRNLQKEGDQGAEDVISLLSDTQRILTVTLVGTNIFSIFAALFAKQFFTIILSFIAPGEEMRLADLVSLILITPFVLIFGEIVPKQFFREHADVLMLRLSKYLRFFSLLFIPAVNIFNAITYRIVGVFGVRKGQSRIRFTKEDLRHLVGAGEENHNGSENNAPISHETNMIHNIFKLEKTLVREVMKPLVDVIAVPLHAATVKTALETARRSGYSRLPVYDTSIINMVGYINIYDILRSDIGEWDDLKPFLREPYYVPEVKRIDDLLQDMLESHTSVAIVFDEHGGCSGFVTLEDIIEEIVGEIEDEFDKRSVMYYEEKPGIYNIDPKMDLDDLREEVNIILPKRDCDTLGGFIYSVLGRVPKENETINYGEYLIQVLQLEPPKIKRVRIERIPREKISEASPDDSGVV